MSKTNKTRIPKNMLELREDLSELYSEIRNKEIDSETAQNAARVAGHLISTVKHEIVYRKLGADNQNIDFMNY